MTPLWTSAEAEAATGGRATAAFAANGVSIDTRTLRPGDLFVALKDVRDGHDFVAQALEKGAAAALVSRVPEGVAADAPLLVVPEVLAALEAMGRAARTRTQARVVAVTGSVGKTSTKEMLRATLGGQGRVHAAEASYNNHWGVPLTLARMPADADFAVIEIGMNHPGEIAPLARLARPHVALITTVAPAHLEAFASLDAIAEEKAAIVEGLEPGGTAILPSDLGVTPILTDRARQAGARTVLFGTSAAADWRLSDVQITPEATIARATHAGTPLLFKVLTPGRHFAANALAVLACAEVLGLDPTIAACDLGLWSPPSGRGTRERILLDTVDEAFFELIDDAFNANPASMEASLDLLAAMAPTDGVGRIAGGRRIAVLGDMLELGETEISLHRAIANHPALSSIAVIHCVGPRMRALFEALPRRQRGEWVEHASDLVPRARLLVDAGDIVLVKGSKGIKVSLVVDALRKLGQSGPSTTRGAE
ncbi:UDP-N-acetylmuramoyl-tripeptide--D-alanyl-D-alanine ligase [Cereibacter sphaeroides]|uniref:UDP-N-acetylmuramoyl-tripeptide--D-alanyl-D- alanine ligase n=1 Tax=Cereibacter sphaeroides TaxID=1063 RepID=UPI001F2AAEB6|nr:UDP-N-acetylmuramoyl-tripeptide--D-alanyl-D-alanine ligase [Cereibacter sphaeroides]MCE6960278.1 UDP-N-acetylmuramoyl-tripeptide--D-alanyl-D-alanine ligase [Cereibacter sphaeroides]MCE6969171.1 UDP-N-acetylmuramoyl-tripeptide--D-alanyl-D-alanine ligase [Cereibacter sphaeroides]MCE6974889.1 UDP-N-acetylmuramoyl-tripeptide--D-alanyl-D-alanine ligase [Cereibacter sphaeroides]